jgi:hypothetical protein
MKKYIFLTFAVFGIGGTQIYVRNKLRYLKQNGWEVSVITTEPGETVLVPELAPYRQTVFPQLLDHPYLLSGAKRRELLRRLCAVIGEVPGEMVIESNFIQAAFWGELLAKKCGARHFVYLIQEEYHLSLKRWLKFFDFKYRRGELAVTTKYAMRQLFGNYRKIPDHQNGFLPAVCYNVVEDCPTDIPGRLMKADFTIGSIGRINKPFVTSMVQGVAEFARRCPGRTILLLLIGGSPDEGDLERIKRIASCAANLKVYGTGAVFPVPKKLLDCVDVFVSSAGAARTSADEGYLTIAIDANDFRPTGVVGFTTADIVHRRPGSPKLSLPRLLRDILIKGRFKNERPVIGFPDQDYMKAFDRHFAFLHAAGTELQYYDIRKTRPKTTVYIHRFLTKLYRRTRPTACI